MVVTLPLLSGCVRPTKPGNSVCHFVMLRAPGLLLLIARRTLMSSGSALKKPPGTCVPNVTLYLALNCPLTTPDEGTGAGAGGLGGGGAGCAASVRPQTLPRPSAVPVSGPTSPSTRRP